MSGGGDGGVEWIEYASRYLRSFRKLPAEIKQKVREREAIFRSDPFDVRLKTHKLHGEFRDYWAYSVDYRYRVLFCFIDEETVIYYDIGDHSIYR